MSKKLYYSVCAALVLLSCLFAFSTIDEKICDLFLQNKTQAEFSTNIVLIKNEASIDAGKNSFSISREVYAEAVMVLRELGADAICVDDDFSKIESNNIFFDEDEYFANCIKACRNVVLPFRFANDAGKTNLIEKFALKNVVDKNDKVTPEFNSVEPCIKVLSDACEYSGFMNISPDKDGKIRRVHLVAKYDGKYYANEILATLLKVLNNPTVNIYNNKIVLDFPGSVKKMIIPRDTSGAVVLNFNASDFSNCKSIDIDTLYRIKTIENKIVKSIQEMEDRGFFDYTPEDMSPDFTCNKFIDRKEYLFNILNKLPDNIDEAFNEYVIAKEDFLECLEMYVLSAADEVLVEVGEKNGRDTSYVEKYFEELRLNWEELKELRKEIKEKAENSLCLFGNSEEQYLLAHMMLYPYSGEGVAAKYDSYFVKVMPWWVSLILAAIICASFVLVFERLDNLAKKITIGAVFAYFSIFVPYIIFVLTGVFTGAIIPLASIYFVVIISVILSIVSKYVLKNHAKERLGKKVDQKILDSYLESNGRVAEKLWLSVAQIEIDNFKKIESSYKNCAELVEYLNEYYSIVTDVVLSNGGIVCSQQGEKMLCVFGIFDKDDVSEKACHTMLELKKKGVDGKFVMNISLFTGNFIAAEFGTKNRMSYSVTGNNVNIAEDVLNYCSEYESKGFLINESTLKEISGSFMVRALDKVMCRHSDKSLRLFEVLDDAETVSDDQWLLIEKWQNALKDYESCKFESAKKAFDYIAKNQKTDRTAKIFSLRCQEFIKNPPPKEWDGIYL
ncbi:MAG: CHASE2 domain-containing protein [Treponema sp.]|nr:CHASE2 domain-containing protein [Treponema sp.]